MNPTPPRPKLAVWKFASCDGCQLSLLDCEDELLALSEQVEIAYFLEASRAVVSGPYDLSIVEGSITTLHDRARIVEVRRASRKLLTIGACATSGGVQALRNYLDLGELTRAVYAHPEYIETLSTSTPISEHVEVDFELHGCPIDKHQLLDTIGALLADRRPNVRKESVCLECKRRGLTCVLVSRGVACLGPVTQAGCGALCPSYTRGCFGCYGPAETHNTQALQTSLKGSSELDLQRLYSTFNVAAPGFVPAHRLARKANQDDGAPSPSRKPNGV
ncbi:MAG TPA: oxidoreductase [Polyangiaceae bacterium]|jgi:coenzyme F420-reducing hydrogenase gamma subunit|nr:oxidoreductase [Polyangiaceae bacterium]